MNTKFGARAFCPFAKAGEPGVHGPEVPSWAGRSLALPARQEKSRHA